MQNSMILHHRPSRTIRDALIAPVALAIVIAAAAPVGAQGIVFDPSNYSQNLLTAARSLTQVNNQIRSLENEALLLINSSKNVASLPSSVAARLKAQIDEINRLTAQANGIAFQVDRTGAQFEAAYPRQYSAAVSSDRMVQDATARWSNTYDALKQTLLTQSKIVEAIGSDGITLQTLMASSSGAVGALQAHQAGNQLAALQIKQALQLQTLLAAQARADALKSAEQQASADAARERFSRFIGNRRAYAGGR
jgi:P-type conjugative transfer protein TrbJ